MPLSIVNWNILYDCQRPLDASRFEKDGKTPSMSEKKASTAALSFFCYTDKNSPSNLHDPVPPDQRQEVKQWIKGKEYCYYRGGSNASERMQQLNSDIQTLAQKAEIVCLQEVTKNMAEDLKNSIQTTHNCFFSYEPGNNHGVMILVKKEIDIVGKSSEVKIENGGLARRVRVVDVRDPETKAVVRIAAAHLYGHHGPAQSVDKEASDLFKRLGALPGKCDAVVIGADVNETKLARSKVSTSLVHYANIAGGAGWQLNLTTNSSVGPIPIQSKPDVFGLCAIMLDKPQASKPLDLSDLYNDWNSKEKAGTLSPLSDHAPIGTTITIDVPSAVIQEEDVVIEESPSNEGKIPVVVDEFKPKEEKDIPLDQDPVPPFIEEETLVEEVKPEDGKGTPAAGQQPASPVSFFQRFMHSCSQWWSQLGAGLWSLWQWIRGLFPF